MRKYRVDEFLRKKQDDIVGLAMAITLYGIIFAILFHFLQETVKDSTMLILASVMYSFVLIGPVGMLIGVVVFFLPPPRNGAKRC